MNHSVKHIFLTGKGGVGKSTVALLAGKYLANAGHKTLVSSLDPAHNTADILDRSLSAGKNLIAPNLWAMEVNSDEYLRNYLKSVEQGIHSQYRYADAFSFTDHFGIIKYSPGLEEYALIQAFDSIRNDSLDMEYFIWDMPPTGLSLRFFQYPQVSLAWLNKLNDLRQLILKKQTIRTKLKNPGKQQPEKTDRLAAQLAVQINYFSDFQALLADPKTTRILTITNDETLSRAEAMRLKKSLAELNIAFCDIIMNRVGDSYSEWIDEETGRNIKGYVLPRSDEELIGDALDRYLDRHSDQIAIIFT